MAKRLYLRNFITPIMLRVVGGYALFLFLWILFSDLLLASIVSDQQVITKISVLKGWIFVIVTATLLYFLLRRYLNALARNQEELRLSDEKFQAIFNSVNDAVFIHDVQTDVQTGQIIDVNNTMCALYKCSREPALQSSTDQSGMGVSPYSEVEAHALLGRVAAGVAQTFAWRARDLTGRLVWVEVSARRARIGPEDRLVVTVRDIEQAQADRTKVAGIRTATGRRRPRRQRGQR